MLHNLAAARVGCSVVLCYNELWIEVSTVWLFTPRLPWTVVGFVTHCLGSENNVKTTTIFLKLMQFVNIVVAEYLLFD